MKGYVERDAKSVIKGLSPLEKTPEISIRDALWWIQDSWMNAVKIEIMQNCFKKSTLFDENYPAKHFSLLEPPSEIMKLYQEVADAAGVKYSMELHNSIFPNDAIRDRSLSIAQYLN
ncbi:hypothetical protein JCM33374_g1975 [Metschnikowia sp. JCM 33374]|nr:hypothetical protein JCM33374_g1975 [Metschnikowia sp. JCM 33374]